MMSACSLKVLALEESLTLSLSGYRNEERKLKYQVIYTFKLYLIYWLHNLSLIPEAFSHSHHLWVIYFWRVSHIEK